MRSRLFNLLTALALLLCGALCTLWVRNRDQFGFTAGGRLWWVMCTGHGVHTRAVAPWPDVVRLRWVADLSADRVPAVEFSGQVSIWQRAGIIMERAAVTTVYNEHGRPASLAEYEHYDWKDPSARPPRSPPLRENGLRVPYWMLLSVSGALPLVRATAAARRWLLGRRRRRRRLCPRCGYDLRASPDRCPECGTTATPAPAP